MDELVSVVIPAYNAEATIDETLQSVRSQTWRDLDIVVVDDGSADRTAEIARRHAACDGRIRVYQQPNAGVAAARNLGWQNSRGDLLSFIDADDLWAPGKTAHQVAALKSADAGTGLVYSWYAVIDAESRIINRWPGPTWQGEVLDTLFVENFVGNGSSVLVTRDALQSAGGFESALHQAGAQGCEDILFYCRVAEHYRFALAPGYLIGYRELVDNMSSNLPRMLRSWLLVRNEMISRHRDRAETLGAGFDHFTRWLVRKAILSGSLHLLPKLLRIAWQEQPTLVFDLLRREIPRTWLDSRAARRHAGGLAREPGPRFEIGSADVNHEMPSI